MFLITIFDEVILKQPLCAHLVPGRHLGREPSRLSPVSSSRLSLHQYQLLTCYIWMPGRS